MKPNIIMIISDDQGAWAMGCSGNNEIITPNIDRLAKEGMRFENFFCTSPVCSPARASLLTGQIPSQHGVHDWLRDDTKQQEEIEYLKGQIGYTDVLKQNGYVCGLSGKWHLGASSKKQKGFDHWFCHKSGGGPYYGAPLFKKGTLYHDERYVSDVITEDAISFIQQQNGEHPFYLQVGYTAPHAPWINNHPKKFVDMYKDCSFDTCQMEPLHPNHISLTDEVLQDLRANQVGYYAAVTAMDDNIGKIMETIDDKKIRENTLIIFTSDNGFSCGQHGFWGKGNGTFPINMYESSVKVPFIMSHPGKITFNKVCNTLVSAYDFMPTLLEYIGLSYDDSTLPGRSFLSSIKEMEKGEHQAIYVLDEYGPNRMIRTATHKYIIRYPYGPDECYNLVDDPNENINLIADECCVEIITSLRFQLESWFQKYVKSEIDGIKENVYGSGQKNLAGLWSNGINSYELDDYIKEHKNFKLFKK